jgi:hypothetical protein
MIDSRTLKRPLHRRRIAFLVCGALIAAGVAMLLVALLSDGEASASEAVFTADLPAQESMAALETGATPLVSAEAVNGIPEELHPTDQVHLLLDDVGHLGVTVAAWPSGEQAVCYKSSNGGGGCFDQFYEPFNWTVSDPDSLGEGKPIHVWGFVSDQVEAVSIVVGGDDIPALVENNTVFVELPDSATRPEDIEGFRISSVDGGEKVYPHAVALPPELDSD